MEVTINLPQPIYLKLEELAKKDRQSIKDTIEQILIVFIKRYYIK